jgi:hypothetical protein
MPEQPALCFGNPTCSMLWQPHRVAAVTDEAGGCPEALRPEMSADSLNSKQSSPTTRLAINLQETTDTF